MKNILLISTIYPLPTKDNKGTAVCHFFAREWVQMGYRVRVVHFQAVFMQFFYWIARMNRKLIAAKTGAVVYTERDKGDIYESNGVEINRIPLFKLIPHGRYSKKTISEAIKRITEWNAAGDFEPDYILGHFPNPQLEVVGLLKDVYPNAGTAIVMHGDTRIMQKVYGKRLPELMTKIDAWGFRNKAVVEEFEAVAGKVNKQFICYSGIPEDYITQKNTHTFAEEPLKFVYVGEMIERKFPVAILDALKKAFPDGNYEMTYVGAGQLLYTIKSRVSSEGLQHNVKTLGKIPRDTIKEQYDHADVMVMISKGEAYGLVYLEAMARGCITIASKKEGFDGVIVDGVNGFLCKAGDSDELAQIMKHISSMTVEQKNQMSEKAIETAKSLTDYLAAKRYVDDVIRLTER